MGYRALLKNYIRHVLRVAGDHYIRTVDDTGALTKRDLAELRRLAAELGREDDRRLQHELEQRDRDPAPREEAQG